MDEDKIGQVMSKPVRTVEPNEKLSGALEEMYKHDIGNVVVVEEQKLVGIVTERDIVRRILKDSRVLQERVNQLMSGPVITASPDVTVQEALEIMLKNKIRQLPVVQEGSLVGIVTDKDLMRSVLRVSYEKLSRHSELEIEAERIAARIAQIVTLLNL
jgi:CBS domain-containing protein